MGEESRSSTCRPLAALKDVAYSTKLWSVGVARPGMMVMVDVAVDDNDDGDVILLSVFSAVLLLILLLPTAWIATARRDDDDGNDRRLVRPRLLPKIAAAADGGSR